MKKNDLLILIALFSLWVMWPNIYRQMNPPKEIPPEVEAVEAQPAAEEPAVLQAAPTPDEPAVPAQSVTAPETTTVVDAETFVLENEKAKLTFSGLGGTLISAVLKSYPAVNEEDSGPIELKFPERRAAAYEGLAGFGQQDVFEGKLEGENRLMFTRTVNGLTLQRVYTLVEGAYQLELEDTFINQSSQALQMPEMAMATGGFYDPPGSTKIQGMQSLGVDTLAVDSDKVKHLAGKMYKELKGATEWREYVPQQSSAVNWVAAKNKYFVQILTPEDDGIYAKTYGKWDMEENRLGAVGASIHFPEHVLSANQSFTRNTEVYTGPKKLSVLKSLGDHKDGVMQLGWFFLPFIGEQLLWLINGLYSVTANYGIAIMVVTLLMRMLFWPLTHKGTESMRRMSELSPQMKEISEKYKDDPQMKQQKLMEFYRENKINPVGGCLPMLVQIPIFLALFYVLRSAIELRFAKFLWIEDLSEADHLFSFGVNLPIFGEYFNLLPILMAVSMYLQQKVAPMTPNTSMDETQAQIQKTMMRMMPVMMLVFLYKFSAGLALYWTTQNCLMIVQHLVYKKRKELKEAHASG